VDHFRAQLGCKLHEIGFRARAQIRRGPHPVEQGGREFAAQYSPRPLQGQKEGSLPFNRQLATWCSAPRNRRWLSVAPGYNETSRLTQKVGSFIKQIKVLNGLIGQHSGDRKSTRLNSSHVKISYAVFCLKKKKT